MGVDDKIENAAKDVTGKAKEAVGDATDNERLEAQGKVDQAAAKVGKVEEDVKDTFR